MFHRGFAAPKKRFEYTINALVLKNLEVFMKNMRLVRALLATKQNLKYIFKNA